MNYLLDTCALIWLACGARELSPAAREACGDASSRIHVSAASAWEIALKAARRKLSLHYPASEWWKRALTVHALIELPITAELAIASTALPLLHADPIDRLLVATAQQHHFVLLTPDHLLAKYPNLSTRW